MGRHRDRGRGLAARLVDRPGHGGAGGHPRHRSSHSALDNGRSADGITAWLLRPACGSASKSLSSESSRSGGESMATSVHLCSSQAHIFTPTTNLSSRALAFIGKCSCSWIRRFSRISSTPTICRRVSDPPDARPRRTATPLAFCCYFGYLARFQFAAEVSGCAPRRRRAVTPLYVRATSRRPFERAERSG